MRKPLLALPNLRSSIGAQHVIETPDRRTMQILMSAQDSTALQNIWKRRQEGILILRLDALIVTTLFPQIAAAHKSHEDVAYC